MRLVVAGPLTTLQLRIRPCRCHLATGFAFFEGALLNFTLLIPTKTVFLRKSLMRKLLQFLLVMALALGGLVVAQPALADSAIFQVNSQWSSANPPAGWNVTRFNTIQAAVNAAGANDIIQVYAGTYPEDVRINKSGLKVSGAGPEVTHIIGRKDSGAANTVEIAANNVLLEGFSITRDGNNPTDWATNVKSQGVIFNQGVSGAVLQNCRISGNRNGVYLNQAQNNTIRNNVITDNRTGIQLANDVSGTVISGNEITNNWTLGIVTTIGDASHITTAIHVNQNNISGNWYGQIQNRWNADPYVLDFSANFLGSAQITRVATKSSEPDYEVQIPTAYGGAATPPAAAPAVIGGVQSARVDYSPWLNRSTDADSLDGFQGSLDDLSVDAASPSASGVSNIQEAIDLAWGDGKIDIYPGNYDETAKARSLYNGTGPYQFGLFISVEKSGLSLVGVDAAGAPIQDAAQIQAAVQTNSTSDFGPSGVFVEGDRVTLAGLKIGQNPALEQNKTIEVIGDAFTLAYCHIAAAGGVSGSVYLDDFRFDAASQTSHVKTYAIHDNFFDDTTLDINSGAGFSGGIAGRVIRANVFDHLAADSAPYALISFTGAADPASPDWPAWFQYGVGGAVIQSNRFLAGEQFIRVRGIYDNSQFNWKQYWEENEFVRAVAVGPNPPQDMREYTYGSANQYTHTRMIGALIQAAADHAAEGDTIRVKAGTYPEQVTLAKNGLKLVSNNGSPASVTLQAPATLPNSDKLTSAVVSVKGGAQNVEIKNLTVSGPGPSGCGSIRAGIFVYEGAKANIENTYILDIRDSSLSGCQNGVGIQVGYSGTPASAATATLKNNLVQGYQKTGIVIAGSGTSATVTGNTVTGAGQTNQLAQNGIQVSAGAVAALTHNTVRGNQCNHASCGPDPMTQTQAVGILLYNPGAGTTVSQNTITQNDLGLYSSSGSADNSVAISANLLTTNRYAAAIFSAGQATFSANEISGAGNLGVAVLSYNGDPANAAVTLTNNRVSDVDTALLAQDETSADSARPALSAANNSWTAQTAAYDNQTSAVFDVKRNWWGSLHGPTVASNSGGDGAPLQGPASYDPWLCSGVDSQPDQTGFQPQSGPGCTAAPTRLVFSAQPGGAFANQALASQPALQAVDGAGNLGVNAVGNVLLALGANPSSAILSGTLTQPLTDGEAAFSGLSLNHGGVGYTLYAQMSGLTAAVSAPFSVDADVDLDLYQTASVASLQPGDPLSLTLTTVNNGAETAENLILTETFSLEMTFISASGSGWNCDFANQTLTCQRASLAGGAQSSVKIDVVAANDTGTLTLQGSVHANQSDRAPENNTTQLRIPVGSQPIELNSKVYLPIAIR
jgi:uncharacterized repeat protein (TIGR01451 family)